MQREEFLQFVRKYIENDPEVAMHVTVYAQQGVKDALSKANERAADMEVALSVLAVKRYKGSDALVRDKLAKWAGQTALCWDWLTHRE